MVGVRIAASGMAWKATDSEKVITVAASTIKWAQWLRVAGNYQLRVGTMVEDKNGSKDQRKEKFDGFQREVKPNKKTWIIKAEYHFFRIMIKSPRCSKISLESPSRRAKFHSKVGIGA
jgi:hypothetical protein